MKKFPVAIVGCTGLVGTTLLHLLDERKFPISDLFFLASHQSAGKQITFQDKTYHIQDLNEFDFSRSKIAFFCVSNDLAKKFAPKAVEANNIVIDKSSYFRNHPNVPLVVPEVNLKAIGRMEKGIIASPNCSTIPIAVALKPIYDQVGITRINISTYQSVSGTGKEAVLELSEQTSQVLNKKTIQPKVYPKQIAFNVLPHIGDFEENGYTQEEMKMVLELKKIFNDPELAVNPTAVRVPVYYGHAAAVHIETKEKISVKDTIRLLCEAKNVVVMTGEFPYPTSACDVAGQDPVFVGRIREDISFDKGLDFWIAADNLRKGAALNAVHIAEYLIEKVL